VCVPRLRTSFFFPPTCTAPAPSRACFPPCLFFLFFFFVCRFSMFRVPWKDGLSFGNCFRHLFFFVMFPSTSQLPTFSHNLLFPGSWGEYVRPPGSFTPTPPLPPPSSDLLGPPSVYLTPFFSFLGGVATSLPPFFLFFFKLGFFFFVYAHRGLFLSQCFSKLSSRHIGE